MTDEETPRDLREAFKAGFGHSDEGFNGEFAGSPPGYETVDEYLDALFEGWLEGDDD